MPQSKQEEQQFAAGIEQYTELAELLKALAHPVRLCIVNGLLSSGGCNVSHIQQCLSLPQSTVSQQLAKLRAAGIIRGARNGLEVCYSVVDTTAIKVVRALLSERGGNC